MGDEKRKSKEKPQDPFIDPNFKPFEKRETKHPTTDLDTFIHLIKGCLGSGILAMPNAMSNCGLWMGLIMTGIVGFICAYCIHILIKCAHILCHRRQVPQLNYPEIAEHAFLDGGEKMAKWAVFMRNVVKVFLFIDLYGCCAIYLILVAENVQQVFVHHFQMEWSIRIWVIIITIPLIFMCLIRNLKYLVPFSLIANLMLLVAVIISFYFILRNLPPISDRPFIVPLARWPLFFGTVIFALECIGVVMSLENDMKTPEHMIGLKSVLTSAFIVVIGVYTLLGFFGYWKYGPDVKGSVTLNLPVKRISAQLVKILTGIAIFFTFTLQFYVPYSIAWDGVKGLVSEEKSDMYDYIFRVILVLLCMAIAVAVPNLSPLISLVGAVCLSTLGLILPSIIELAVYDKFPGYGTMKWRLWKNIFLILFGILGFCTGLYTSVLEIKEKWI